MASSKAVAGRVFKLVKLSKRALQLFGSYRSSIVDIATHVQTTVEKDAGDANQRWKRKRFYHNRIWDWHIRGGGWLVKLRCAKRRFCNQDSYFGSSYIIKVTKI